MTGKRGSRFYPGAATDKPHTVTIGGGVESVRAKRGLRDFELLFDNSSSPDRVKFLEGDEALNTQVDALQKADFPVKFPDVSSIKTILLGTISCDGTACKFEVQPLNSMQQSAVPQLAQDK